MGGGGDLTKGNKRLGGLAEDGGGAPADVDGEVDGGVVAGADDDEADGGVGAGAAG
jgi:hypothetical protein